MREESTTTKERSPQSKAKQSKAKQSKAKQSKAKQSKAKQSKAKQSKAKQSKRQDKTKTSRSTMDLGMCLRSMNCSTPDWYIMGCTLAAVTGSINHFTTDQIV
jgi:hypothetical protein